MLPDDERKTLLVLHHFHLHHKRMPTWHELQRMTGRRQWVLIKAIRALQERRAIEWDGENPSSIRIVAEWQSLI